MSYISVLLKSERLTCSWPIHVLEEDSEVNLMTATQVQNDDDYITLSDDVIL